MNHVISIVLGVAILWLIMAGYVAGSSIFDDHQPVGESIRKGIIASTISIAVFIAICCAAGLIVKGID